MSLCMMYGKNGRFFMCSDTRSCIEVEGQQYHVGDNSEKIKQFGDKVIFIGGYNKLTHSIFDSFEKSDQTIESLGYIAKTLSLYFATENNIDDKLTSDIVVFVFEDGNPVIYNISSKYDFRIQGYPLNPNEATVVANGFNSDRAMQILQKHLDEKKDVVEGLKIAYENVADEGVGGDLILYEILANSINRNIFKIPDNKQLKKAYFHSIMNATEGFKIQTRPTTTDNWLDRFFVDTNGKLIAEELQANKIAIKNGNEVLIDANTKTIDFTKFNTIVGQLSATNIDVDTITIGDANITGTLSANKLNLNQNLLGVNVNNKIKIDSQGNLEMNGGSITGAANINVTTDVTIGKSLVLSETSASGGIRWGAEAFAPAIYREPVTGRLDIDNQGKPIYANGIRIDQPIVAVFG